MTVDWEFFDRMTPDDAIAVLDALEAGEEVRSTRGPVVRGFRAASRTISGHRRRRADRRGRGADELMLANVRAAAERGVARRGRGGADMTLTPVLTAHWDEPDSYTIDGYRRHGGYEQVRHRASRWAPTP